MERTVYGGGAYSPRSNDYGRRPDLLSIKEFARFTGVTERLLRHYDSMGLLSPAVRAENGYRYYSPDQIAVFNTISTLTGMKFSLAKIENLSSGGSSNNLMHALFEQDISLIEELRRLQEACAVSCVLRGYLLEAISVDLNSVERTVLKSIPISVGPENDNGGSESAFYDGISEFYEFARSKSINTAYPVGCKFDSVNDMRNDPYGPTNFFSTAVSGTEEISEGDYLVAYSKGGYGSVGDLPERLTEYADKNGLRLSGPVHLIYIPNELGSGENYKFLCKAIVHYEERKHSSK